MFEVHGGDVKRQCHLGARKLLMLQTYPRQNESDWRSHREAFTHVDYMHDVCALRSSGRQPKTERKHSETPN
jgi:hypothetical protein